MAYGFFTSYLNLLNVSCNTAHKWDENKVFSKVFYTNKYNDHVFLLICYLNPDYISTLNLDTVICISMHS